MMRTLCVLIAATLFASCTPKSVTTSPPIGEWTPLFNGENLDGWIVKISGYPMGENYGNTFRVEDGMIQVAYDEYGDFGRQFGSLFYHQPFSHYRLRLEYRFVDDQAAGGPTWGFRDSGIQFHSPDPESMLQAQEFPISVELNLIGNGPDGDRTTGNLCSPGSHVMIDGTLFTENCGATSRVVILGDEWATAEIEVWGNERITHSINGTIVATYDQPHFDEASPDAQRLLAAGVDASMGAGYISLQSNSHPIHFRNIEIMVLDPQDL